MKVLVACEESQEVCKAFRQFGCESFSCDIIECSGGLPEYHIKDDCLKVIDGNCIFYTQDGIKHTIDTSWDLVIAHPPCTFLANSGNAWFNEKKYGFKAVERKRSRIAAIEFFLRIAACNCDKICIENPVGIISTVYKKPSQIIQPFDFGDSACKRTCLWLKNLPCLFPEKVVLPGDFYYYKNGKRFTKWLADSGFLNLDERRKIRSKTFPGIAYAMAHQWSFI